MVQRFDRHTYMDSETLSEILDIIGDLSEFDFSTRQLENMLFGLFDGYDYTSQITESTQLADVTQENPSVGRRISAVCQTIEKYPKFSMA